MKKNEKIKTWQSSNRTWPNAGPLPRRPTAHYYLAFVHEIVVLKTL
jgi:hypothetical protein